MNVFISIIEEAYASSKEKNKENWIYSYLKIDPKYVSIRDLENKQDQPLPQLTNVRGSLPLPKVKSESKKESVSPIKTRNLIREIGIRNINNDDKLKEELVKTLNALFMNVKNF
jgi:hypothetical protein